MKKIIENDRTDECREAITAVIAKFRKEYAKAVNNAVLYAPEIQEQGWFDEVMYLDEVLDDTYFVLRKIR